MISVFVCVRFFRTIFIIAPFILILLCIHRTLCESAGRTQEKSKKHSGSLIEKAKKLNEKPDQDQQISLAEDEMVKIVSHKKSKQTNEEEKNKENIYYNNAEPNNKTKTQTTATTATSTIKLEEKQLRNRKMKLKYL